MDDTKPVITQTANRKPQTANRKPQTANRKPQTANRKPQEAEFDKFAEKYSEDIESVLSIALKGSPHEYFNQYKLFYLNKIFVSQKKFSSGKLKILDYGCGVGLFSRTLIEAMPDITLHGFDVSSESIKKVPEELCTGDNFFTSELHELDNDYDIALLVTVLHHVPIAERAGVMNNIRTRLKPNGKLIIIEHNTVNPLTRKIVENNEVDADAVMLTTSESENLLREAGFSEISSKYIVFFPKQLAFFRVLDRFISWLPLGAQFLTTGTLKA